MLSLPRWHIAVVSLLTLPSGPVYRSQSAIAVGRHGGAFGRFFAQHRRQHVRQGDPDLGSNPRPHSRERFAFSPLPRHLRVCTRLSAEADPLISTARLHVHQLTRCLFVLWTACAHRAGGAENAPARGRARDSGRAIRTRCVALLPRGRVHMRTAPAHQGALVHAHRLWSKPPHHIQRDGARHACSRARWWP